MAKIIIHPYYDAEWCCYFIKGLIDLYGFNNISFSKKGFPDVPDRSGAGESSFLYFILDSDAGKIKFSVDAMDTFEFDDMTLEWCDVYAKVNTDPDFMPEKYAYKVTPSAPHFPIRIGNYFQIAQFAFRTFEFSLNSYVGHFKKHIYRQIKYGLDIDKIKPVPSRKNYVYMSSSFWKNNIDTNESRINFMHAAKSIPWITFEGGFIPRIDKIPIPEPRPADLIFPKPNKKDYVKGVLNTSVAFTSPSVYGAHSFRISEYLAMGKAIMCPPLKRLTTTPLIHGEHIHFVEPEVEPMKEAIELINRDDAYRRKLETGARSYYENFSRPMKMMEKVIAIGKNIAKQS